MQTPMSRRRLAWERRTQLLRLVKLHYRMPELHLNKVA